MRYTTQKAIRQNERFIYVWHEAIRLGEGHEYVAHYTNLTPSQVRTRIDYLRRHDIKLPRMKNGRKKRK